VTGDSWRYLKLTQDVAAVNVQGSLPDWAALWSKPASLAVGAEWRRETANQTSDAVSQAINNFAGLRGAASSQSGTLGGFYASNPQPISGRVTVKELYGELALPVAADRPFIKALDLNAAVRLTDYSTSGQVVTWKLGGVWKPVQDLTLRLTRSRDIRAPNILELFSGGVAGNATVIDPKTGATVPFLGYTRGNPDLKPEKANTLTFGMVCSQPSCAGSICRWTITTSRSARRLPRFRRRIRSTNARRAPRWSARKSSSPTAPITSTCCPSIWPRRATAGSISRRVTALGCWAGG
jgi:outer membrane receptor protein involved in Fe transport